MSYYRGTGQDPCKAAMVRRLVTVECHDSTTTFRSAMFPLFDGRLQSAGPCGGLQSVFGATNFWWEDSSAIATDLAGFTLERVPEGVDLLRIFKQPPRQPGPQWSRILGVLGFLGYLPMPYQKKP